MNPEKALNLLKKHGYKYTGKREALIEIMAQKNRYLSAREIMDHMKERYPGISLDTVYRNLSLFEELKILEGTEWTGERRYRLHCGEDEHHHHLICTDCGRTRRINICPMNAILGEPEDFKITGHKFEIYGRCTDCGAAET